MFTPLLSCTRFAAHNEMCEHIESMDDTVIDFSFRGRSNYFAMERTNQDGSIQRYILYVFVIYTECKGWMMKVIREDEMIPNVDCPIRIIKLSSLMNEGALAWRNMIIQLDKNKALERESALAELKSKSCICRHTKTELAPLKMAS